MTKPKRGRVTPKGTVPPRHTRSTYKVRNTARTLAKHADAAQTAAAPSASQMLALAIYLARRRGKA